MENVNWFNFAFALYVIWLGFNYGRNKSNES
jgi:hypothetical protein